MTVTVEFYGIPKQRAGVASAAVDGRRLDEVLRELGRRFPTLGEACFEDGRLRTGYVANLNGARFVTDPATPLSPGDSLLILTADVGGA